PWSCTPPQNPPAGPGNANSGGCLVGVHSGPDVHDHPQIIIHTPNNPFAHTDEMWSQHAPPGCNVLFGDGSVRYLSTFINPYTWWALSTMNLGDIPQGDFSVANETISTTKRTAIAAGIVGLPVLCVCWFVWWGRPPQLGADEDVF